MENTNVNKDAKLGVRELIQELFQTLEIEPKKLIKFPELDKRVYIVDNFYNLMEIKENVLFGELEPISSLELIIANVYQVEKISVSDYEKGLLTFLKSIGYNYIARDLSGKLYAYIYPPIKEVDDNVWDFQQKESINLTNYNSTFLKGDVSIFIESHIYLAKIMDVSRMFLYVLWSDEKPYEIDELLEGRI